MNITEDDARALIDVVGMALRKRETAYVNASPAEARKTTASLEKLDLLSDGEIAQLLVRRLHSILTFGKLE